MEIQQVREWIVKELPTLMRQDQALREWVLSIGRTQFADAVVTENRFDQMMQMLNQKIDEDRQARTEWNRKWEENQRQLAEMERKSDERWAEWNRK